MKKLTIFCILVSISGTNIAVGEGHKSSLDALHGDENLPPIDDSINDKVAGDQVLPPIGKKNETFNDILKDLQDTLKEEEGRIKKEEEVYQAAKDSEKVDNGDDHPEVSSVQARSERMVTTKQTRASQDYKKAAPLRIPRELSPDVFTVSRASGKTVTVFTTNLGEDDDDFVIIPSGAHAFGRVKFGELVTPSGQEEVMAELDYAFLGPNGSVAEMTGCVVWISVSSHFHTRRVKGMVRDMTCTAPSGRVFTVNMTGPIVGSSKGYAGVDSDIIMEGPAVAAVLEHLGNTVKVFGQATAAVETTTTGLAAENVSEKVTNITGNKRSYIGGKVIEANGDFLKYIASFFKSMEPYLAVESGRLIHIVNRHNIKVPKEFFVFKKEQKTSVEAKLR